MLYYSLLVTSTSLPSRFSHASGTPLSVLDPAGYPSVEQTYKRMDETLKVRRLTARLGLQHRS
jgi:hypothetical protein